MNILGISAGFHDAAISIVSPTGDVLFGGHSERYSKIKNDPNIHDHLIESVSRYDINIVSYYEKPFRKQLRQLYSGQGINWKDFSLKQIIKNQLKDYGEELCSDCQLKSFPHHLSHAAAGFQTSSFDRATVVVIDAVGEFETITIWAAEYVDKKAKYKKLWSQKYPHSIGLFYSAMTQEAGLKPNEEEYILMGMSAYGDYSFSNLLRHHYISDSWNILLTENMHAGATSGHVNYLNKMDLAAGTQQLTETLISNVMRRARQYNWSNNLVYMGGVALNCLANTNLFNYFNKVWIMPNPGDAGSSLGAAALAYGKKLNWVDAYLGHDILGPYPVNGLLDELLTNKIVGVASGPAEFGPRALGNRSLLADPRGPAIKDQVNEIKQRQKFRPFAPVILEEYAEEYFEMPVKESRYMQFVAKCKYPEKFPAIVHVDESSRVQTVPKNNSGIRELLEKWFVLTGCPMLLNTSLNVKGQPMVNDRQDADRFQKIYNIKVLS